MNNLKLRFISALIIGSIFISAILFSSQLFIVIMAIVLILSLTEWYSMTNSSSAFCLLGLIIIPLPISILWFIKTLAEPNWFLLSYFMTIWSVDSLAMIGGKSIGGPKLAVRLSPNKTISGLFCGVIGAILAVQLIQTFYPDSTTQQLLWSQILILGIFAQASDLFISYFKRKFNIKDTGCVIPGHGGVLDRFDSIILTAPIALYMLYY